MSDARLDHLSAIGWLGLVALPYTLDLLSSPMIDRFVPPFWGRRRGWILLAQICVVVGILLLTLQMSLIPEIATGNRSVALQAIPLTAMLIAFLERHLRYCRRCLSDSCVSTKRNWCRGLVVYFELPDCAASQRKEPKALFYLSIVSEMRPEHFNSTDIDFSLSLGNSALKF